MLNSIKAILFDLDGVIVDSAPFHFKSWKRFMSKYRIKFLKNDFKHTFGMTNEQILRRYISQNLTEEDIVKMSDEKEEIYREVAKGKIKSIKGSVDFVKISRERFKIALVSSTPRQNIDFVLSEFSLNFDCIISSSDITKGKPDPECFILASRKLQVETKYCAVIEDSQHGIDAGKSAGCPVCIGLLTTHKNLENADFLVKDFNEIKKIFGL